MVINFVFLSLTFEISYVTSQAGFAIFTNAKDFPIYIQAAILNLGHP